MPQGNCKLCGKYRELTFEHVPPRATFNKTTRYRSVPYMDFVKSENILSMKIKGKVEQGGVGYFSLCSSCNNFLGINYVSSYTSYSNSFIDFAKKRQYNYFEFVMHDFAASKVLKQIASMFLSINDSDFSINNPDLTRYVLDPSSQELPSKYRFFNYLNTDGHLRNIGVSVVGDFSTGLNVVGTELAFPPLGHVMTIDFNGTLPCHFEITNFKDFGPDDRASIDFKIFRLPTYIPFFLDYRDKETIENTIKKNMQ